MRHFLSWLLAAVLVLVGAGIALAQPTGPWVAQRMDQRERGEDAALTMDMTLIDKKQRVRHRKLTILRKDFEGSDKLLLKFTFPKDIQGTSFLVWERRGRDNERFLYLPALGRIRRIATQEKNENFAGTDFSYEDISGRKLEDYDYELIDEHASHDQWECYVLASYPRDEDSRYPKILSWVRKDIFVAVKAEYYNKKGEPEKTYQVGQLKAVDGIWTILRQSMENHKSRHKTNIMVRDVQYNRGIPGRRFERRELKSR
jgi:hypothetical protein